MTLKDRLDAAFIIVAQPRSGSTLLAAALHAHPHLTCHDELFSPGWVHGYRPKPEADPVDPEQLLVERDSDPERFLVERVLDRAGTSAQVGFKAVYSDILSRKPLALFLQELVFTNRIRVVHLRRLNMLRCFISVERMRLLGIAHSHNSEARDSALPLDETEFLRFVLEQDGNADTVNRAMNVVAQPRYEHLPQGYNMSLDGLGAVRRPFQANLGRMSSHSLGASIAEPEGWVKWDFPRPAGFVKYTD
ncbi:sulfotransferase [Paracoccus sanguinis]|uniref:Sulfotransferase family protein n=1 Tax=Paracoccus sanguinis TaxID=1545044 RepID=A0A099GKJ4_9RHOB|nr:sulfotransferase [Paracoccus sanguinis]KGJ13479.1 hypothetical protein IX54_11650 [Paracoccus sanguinis]KGJ22648.1 hypothetical protein IX56_06860 [Paracoccus sanguinis]